MVNHDKLIVPAICLLAAYIASADDLLQNVTSDFNYDYFELSDYGTSISLATVHIIRSCYVPISSALSVTSAAMTKQTGIRQSAVVNNILLNVQSKIGVTFEQYWSVVENHQKRFFNLIFVDGYPAFRKIYNYMNPFIYDYTGYYTIVMTESTSVNNDDITKILEDCWGNKITNVIILVAVDPTPTSRTAVYSYFPYTRLHCERVVPVVINVYSENDKFLYAEDLFPPKTRHLHHCPLIVAVVDVEPFVMVTERKDGSHRLNGIDGLLIHELSKRIHFKATIKTPPNGERQGLLEPKYGNSTGALKMLYSGEVNISIGSMSITFERLRYLSPSISYYQSQLVFIVPKGRPLTPFEKLFLPFHLIIWCFVLGLFGFGLLVILVLRFDRGHRDFVVGPNNQTPFLNMVVVFLGGFMTILPRRNFARYIWTVWIFGCLVLRNAYQGALFHMLQTPKASHPPQTIDELAAAKYPLYMDSNFFYLFDQVPKAIPFIRSTPFLTKDEEYRLLTTDTFKGAFLRIKAKVAHYNLHHKNNTVLPSSEDLFSMPFYILFEKHSCLTAAVNNELRKYASHGLIEHWVQKFVDPRFLFHSKKPPHRRHHALRMDQVRGAFVLCGLIMVANFAVFVLERLSLRVDILRRIFEVI